MDDEQAARIDHPDGAAHVDEVAGAEAGPAGGDAGRDAGGADHEAGLVADLGIAAGRAEPYLVDRLVLSERGLEARDESVVDRALGEEDRLGTLFPGGELRSEEHTSELQSLMRISYAVFCLKKKKQLNND